MVGGFLVTFLEICQRVIEEADNPDEAASLNDTLITADTLEFHRRVILTVQRVYRNIQRRHNTWEFHHQSGTFLTSLDDGTKEYSVANVRSIMRQSLVGREQGQTARWPLTWLSYEDWVTIFQLQPTQNPGIPLWFVENPDGTFRLEPGPDRIVEVLGDWYRTLHELTVKDDEPLWESEFHELIVWEACKALVTEYETLEGLALRVQMELPPLYRQFVNRFLMEN